MDALGIIGLLIIGALVIALVILLVMVPIFIAKGRGVSGGELTTITILSWVGLLIGITWIIALILALVYKPRKWIDKDQGTTNLDLDALSKLYELKKKGVISKADYDKEKKKLLGRTEDIKTDNIDALSRLYELKKKGVLTAEEYAKEKAKLI